MNGGVPRGGWRKKCWTASSFENMCDLVGEKWSVNKGGQKYECWKREGWSRRRQKDECWGRGSVGLVVLEGVWCVLCGAAWSGCVI